MRSGRMIRWCAPYHARVHAALPSAAASGVCVVLASSRFIRGLLPSRLQAAVHPTNSRAQTIFQPPTAVQLRAARGIGLHLSLDGLTSLLSSVHFFFSSLLLSFLLSHGPRSFFSVVSSMRVTPGRFAIV